MRWAGSGAAYILYIRGVAPGAGKLFYIGKTERRRKTKRKTQQQRSMACPTFTLNTGAPIPAIGLGMLPPPRSSSIFRARR